MAFFPQSPVSTANSQCGCGADGLSRDGGRRWRVGRAGTFRSAIVRVKSGHAGFLGNSERRSGAPGVRLGGTLAEAVDEIAKQRLPFGNRLNQVIDSLFFAP